MNWPGFLPWGPAGIAGLVAAGWLAARLLRARGWVENILAAFLAQVALLFLVGVSLSRFHLFSILPAWCLGILLFDTAAAIAWRLLPHPRTLMFPGLLAGIRSRISGIANECTAWEKAVLLPLLIALAIAGAGNALGVALSVPNVMDGLITHLPRAAYALQRGSLDFFDAQTWSQATYPVLHPILLSFTFLVSGGRESLTNAVQFVCYWASLTAVYGICRECGMRRPLSLMGAAVFGLLAVLQMQAATVQSDLVMAALLGTAVHFLLRFRRSRATRDLGLVAVSLGLGLAVKAVFLLYPAALVPLVFVCIFPGPLPMRRENLAAGGRFAVILAAVFILLVLPSGYAGTWRRFGNPIGPSKVAAVHSFSGWSLTSAAGEGGKNLLRYAVDFLEPAGVYPFAWAERAGELLRAVPKTIIEGSGIRLEEGRWMRSFFRYAYFPCPNPEVSWWGFLGFTLVWPGCLWALGGGKKRSTVIRSLAVSFLLFFLLFAFSGPYQGWGRYFAGGAVLAVPAAAAWIGSAGRRARAYLAAVLLAGSIFSLSITVCGPWKNLVAIRMPDGETMPPFYLQDRMTQMLALSFNLFRPPAYWMADFDRRVPADAVVGLLLPPYTPEYALFGKRWSRRIMPLNGFMDGPRPAPPGTEYLVFSDAIVPAAPGDVLLGIIPASPGNVLLGDRVYLRDLRR